MAAVALGWGSRLSGIPVALVTTPLLLRCLGADQYSVFMLIQSLAPWVGLTALGIGPALKNIIASSRARGESDAGFRAAAGCVLLTSGAVSGVALAFAAPALSGPLFGRLAVDPIWANRTLQVGTLLLLLAAVGNVGTETLFGDLRASLAYAQVMGGHLLRLALVVLVARVVPGPSALFWFTVAYLGPLVLFGVAALAAGGVHPVARLPRPAAGRLLRASRPFLVNGVIASAVNNVDYLIMSQVLGGKAIATYAVMMMIVSVLLGTFTTVLVVEWPRWTAALIAGEREGVRWQVTRIAAGGAVLGILAAGVAALALPAVLRAWLGGDRVQVGTVTILLFFGYLAIRLWTDTFTVGLLADSQAAWTAKVALIQAMITGPAEYFLGKRLGINGIILALILGQLATATWLNAWRFLRHDQVASAA